MALLRGVNVGGKTKVAMPVLREALTAAGYGEVRTYINSGNVIFSVDPSAVPADDDARNGSESGIEVRLQTAL